MALQVDSESYWAPFHTAFPALEGALAAVEGAVAAPRACVIGAGDGKFVIPLIERGWFVDAIELDPTFINGGVIDLRDGPRTIKGLRPRVAEIGASGSCRVIGEDYMTWDPEPGYDLAMTSGLWSMPVNRCHTLARLVRRQQSYVRPGGICFADYFMPTNADEEATRVCPELDELAGLFDNDVWDVVQHEEVGLIGESHLGWEEWHEHRYASIIAFRRRGA